jgi:hypothetical protein
MPLTQVSAAAAAAVAAANAALLLPPGKEAWLRGSLAKWLLPVGAYAI